MTTHAASIPMLTRDVAPDFRRDGYALIDGAVDPALLARCRDSILGKSDIARRGTDDVALDDRRFSNALCIDGPLADPAIWASPAVMALVDAVIGADAVIDSFGLIVSRPGAPDQRIHSDGRLFPETRLDAMLPCFAITVAIPLVTMDAISGSTGFCTGSHRTPPAALTVDAVPTVAVGSALAWDYRVIHQGLANRGEALRLVLFAVYCRSWWGDAHTFGFGRSDKLLISSAALATLSPRDRQLLSRAQVVDTAPAHTD